MIDAFFLKHIVCIFRTPIVIYNQDFSIYSEYCKDYKIDYDKYLEFVKRAENDRPYIEVDDAGNVLCAMWDAKECRYLVIGQICISGYNIKKYNYIPYCPKEMYTSIIIVIWKVLADEELSPSQIWVTDFEKDESVIKSFTENMFEIHESGEPYSFYFQEQMEYDCIKRGDVEGLMENMNNIPPQMAGRLANDTVRNYKNIAICSISEAARCAIEGGLNHEIAYVMCDTYIKNIEENLDSPMQIEKAVRDAEVGFALEVHNTNSIGSNSLVMKVKDYVFKYIHEQIFIKDIAKELGVSPNYLSDQFSQSENMTLKQYIINEKIKCSEYLLKYSEYSLQEISSFCAFSSQSRFTSYFQRKNHITPAKYRKNHRTVINSRKS